MFNNLLFLLFIFSVPTKLYADPCHKLLVDSYSQLMNPPHLHMGKLLSQTNAEIPYISNGCGTVCSINIAQALLKHTGTPPIVEHSELYLDILQEFPRARHGTDSKLIEKILFYVAGRHSISISVKKKEFDILGHEKSSEDNIKIEDLLADETSIKVVSFARLKEDGTLVSRVGHALVFIKAVRKDNRTIAYFSDPQNPTVMETFQLGVLSDSLNNSTVMLIPLGGPRLEASKKGGFIYILANILQVNIPDL